MRRYLGGQLNDQRSHVVVNAHPPASALIALPFARLGFADAFLAWNFVSLAALAASLWIVQRQLKIAFSAWSVGPLVALLLLCFPLWEQCRLGQLTLALLLLVTATWAAERSGRPLFAGALPGAAASIKVFPGFLFLYYGLSGRWKVVAVGLVTLACINTVTAIMVGIDAYHSYLFTVLPEVQWFRVGWNNDSLWGFWSRLFDPAGAQAGPVAHRAPVLQPGGVDGAVSALVGRCRGRVEMGGPAQTQSPQKRFDLRPGGRSDASGLSHLLGTLSSAIVSSTGGGLDRIAGFTVGASVVPGRCRCILAGIPAGLDSVWPERADGHAS